MTSIFRNDSSSRQTSYQKFHLSSVLKSNSVYSISSSLLLLLLIYLVLENITREGDKF